VSGTSKLALTKQEVAIVLSACTWSIRRVLFEGRRMRVEVRLLAAIVRAIRAASPSDMETVYLYAGEARVAEFAAKRKSHQADGRQRSDVP
jgi:hypothetical protein